MPAGRPTKYKPEMCSRLTEMMGQGKSKAYVATQLGVHIDTLYEWGKVHPEFSEALKLGEQASVSHWEELGHKGVTGQIEGFNASAWIFNMKNRAHWRDKTEVTGEGGGPIKTETKVLNVVGVAAKDDE